jgi:hypothetical protein
MELDTEMSEEKRNVTAFDFDGVFIPDCDIIASLGGEEDFYDLTMHMKPMFEPVGEWILLTARLVKHEEKTKSWLFKHFKNQPKQIFHSRTEDETPVDYKTRILKENDIDVFIESDPVICRHLEKECEGKIIVNFAEFCQMYLNYNAGA